jgi:hypothetical protein
MALFPTVETRTISSLRWRCLVVLVGCWGRKTGCLVALTLVLISSLLVVLTVLLLLLRKLPLVLLLLVLTLMLVLVTLLEWLRWVARVAGTAATPNLRSTNLAFPVLHLPTLPFCHDCSIDKMLEGREGVVHQLIVEGINQSSQEAVLPLGIRVDIFWGITRQLQKLIPVLADGQGTLFQGEKFLLPHYHQSLGHMVATEVVLEFFPSDGFKVGMGGKVRLPPRLGCSPQLSGTVQHLLTIIALGSVQLTLHSTQPIFGVHGIIRVGKNRGMAPHEFCPLVSRHLWHLDLHLRLRRWWLLLHLLHSC